jgi:hypothetical protein
MVTQRRVLDREKVRISPFALQALVSILAVMALVILSNAAFSWTQRTINDVRYGTPRTVTMQAQLFGHADTGVVATNMAGQVVILVYPDNDIGRQVVLLGPYLFGADGALEVPHISVADINGDQQPDLVLMIKNEQVVYLNRGDTTLSLITAEERAALLQQQH